LAESKKAEMEERSSGGSFVNLRNGMVLKRSHGPELQIPAIT
jgi:hypothetical protein